MLAYLYALFSGDDIETARTALLYGSVVGGALVGIGIVWEAGKLDIPTVLVVVGVVFEAYCTIKLFVIDGRISDAQQVVIQSQNDKIITLESAFAPREFDQSGDIAKALTKFKSEFKYLVIAAPGLEPQEAAGQIRFLFKEFRMAGILWSNALVWPRAFPRGNQGKGYGRAYL